MPGEQGVHVVANAIAEVVADDTYVIQPGDEAIAIKRRELADDI